MKTETKAVADTVKNLDRVKSDFIDSLIKINFSGVCDGKSIMHLKQKYLYAIADALKASIGAGCCYFCQSLSEKEDGSAKKEVCRGCGYGKVHGICDTESSTYSMLRMAIYNLRTNIEQYYTGKEDFGPKKVEQLVLEVNTVGKVLTIGIVSWPKHLRGRINFRAKNGFIIKSVKFPELTPECLYLPGREEEHDKAKPSFKFKSFGAMGKYLSSLEKAVKEFNNKIKSGVSVDTWC